MDTTGDQLPVVWGQAQTTRFWKKLVRVVTRVGFADDLLAAFYCAMDRRTPAYARGVLLGALAYFVLPTDAIPDVIAGLGFTDDASVLMAAITMLGRHITPEHRRAAQDRLDSLLR